MRPMRPQSNPTNEHGKHGPTRSRRARRCDPALATVAASFLCQGCFLAAAHVDTGYVSSAEGKSGRRGVHLRGRAALFPAAASVRGKITEDVQQIALEPELTTPIGVLPVYAAAGAHVFQLEHVDGQVDFGMFSPVLEVGALYAFSETKTGWTKHRGTIVLVNATWERDFRFGGAPAESFYTINLGVGAFEASFLGL